MKFRRRLWNFLRLAGRLETAVSIRGALARLKRQIAVWADIRAFPPLAVIAGLDCVAGLVLGRKWSDGPPLYLTNMRLLFAALAVAALAIGSRWWLSRMESEPPARWLRVLLAALCVLPMLALLSLANSQHSPWIVSLASALAVASGSAVLWWHRVAPLSTAPAEIPIFSIAAMRPSSETTASETTARAVSETQLHPAAGSAGSARHVRNADSCEWTKRTTGESGQVLVEGQVIAEFVAGQTVVAVHFPFSPAFDCVPEFTCQISDDVPVRARTPAVYRYGARVELKRTGDTSQPARVEIRFCARASAPKSSRAA